MIRCESIIFAVVGAVLELLVEMQLGGTVARALGDYRGRRLPVGTSAAARRLREEGFTVRDIGSVLGLSYHRAHQLIRADPQKETPLAGR